MQIIDSSSDFMSFNSCFVLIRRSVDFVIGLVYIIYLSIEMVNCFFLLKSGSNDSTIDN